MKPLNWVTEATAIRPELPVNPRAIAAIHPQTKPDVTTVAHLVAARTAEARDIAECPEADGWWYEPSRTPASVRLAIWDSVIRTVRGQDGTFTDDERAAILDNPRRHGKRVGGVDIEEGSE